MKSILLASTLLFVAIPASAYDLKNLSSQDILTIGRALDKLPREETDANGLYRRIQNQLSEQDQAAAKATKANEDAQRAKIEDEVRKKLEAEKTPTPDTGDKK